VYRQDLVDPLLKQTYKELPKLPRYVLKAIDYALLTFFCFFIRMADYSSSWGPSNDEGGFLFSSIKTLYKSPNME